MREDVTTEYGAESKNERVLETGSYLQLVLRLALPAMIVIIVMVLYNLADTFFIGQMGNPEKIAAISVLEPCSESAEEQRSPLHLGRRTGSRSERSRHFAVWEHCS